MRRAEKESPRPGTRGAAHRKTFGTSESSTARLIWALRTHRWSPSELQERDRRRTRRALSRAHLDAAVAAWRRDRDLCAWHCRRMAEVRA